MPDRPLSLPMVRLLAWLTTPHGAKHAREGYLTCKGAWTLRTIKQAAAWGWVTNVPRLTMRAKAVKAFDCVRITAAGRRALKLRGELPAPDMVLVTWCTTCGEPVLADREEVDVDCPRCPVGTDKIKSARFVLDEVKGARRG